jgi:hypothetical protein
MGNVARMRERNTYRICLKSTEVTTWGTCVDEGIILTWRCGLDPSALLLGLAAVSCEQGNAHSGSTKGWTFLDQLRRQLLEKDSAPWR